MIPDRNAAWTWHQDPRAVHIDGVTYLGYVDGRGNIKAYSYDHLTGAAEESILNGNLLRDDHVAPILFERDDGRFICQYARQETGLRQRISVNAHDISAWQPETTIYSETSNYPNPVSVSDDIHMYTRRDLYDQYRRVSTDDGESWTAGLRVSNFDKRTYLKTARLDGSRYYLALTSATPNISNRVFCLYYEEGAYYEADGTQIATEAELPVTEADLTTLYEVDSDDFGALRVWDVLALSDSDVRMLIADVDDPDNHYYYELRWDGSTWSTTEIVNSGGPAQPSKGYYSGGLCYAGDDPDTVYLSQDDGGTHEIYQATTTDGSTWSVSAVTSSSEKAQWRPMRVRDGVSDLPIVWLDQRLYAEFTNYQQTVTSDLSGSSQPEEPTPPATNPYQGLSTEVDGDRVRIRSVIDQ